MTASSACSYCRQVFPTASIEEWVDGGGTPLCPLCGVDCVHAGSPSPLELLDRFRGSFGHRPDDSDPSPFRELQRLSERLTAGTDAISSADLLQAIRWRAQVADLLFALHDDDAYGQPWVVTRGIDHELKHHRDRFQALPEDARRAAWGPEERGGESMPYWCLPDSDLESF